MDSAVRRRGRRKRIGRSIKPYGAPRPDVWRPGAISICVLLFGLTWIVFGTAIGNGFINYDDQIYVYQNPVVSRGLTLPGVVWAFTHTVCANWHPITVLSHMLDCSLFGLNPWGHHLTNVLWHSVAVVLLFLVLREITGCLGRSAFVAAVFAVHPLHVESVAWVSERKDILSAIFFVLMLGSYSRYTRSGSAKWYLGTIFLFAAGLMSKPMLVTVPFLLLLIDYWPLKRFELRDQNWRSIRPHLHLLYEKWPLLLLSALSCVATVIAQQRTIAALDKLPMASRIGNAFVATTVYIRQMFWPTDLAVLYPIPNRGLSVSSIYLCAAAIIITSGISVVLAKKKPYIFAGWFWFLGMLVPVIGIIQVGLQAHADRYTYLPEIGLYIVTAWAVFDLATPWRNREAIFVGSSIVIICGLGFLSHKQISYWHDDLTLWSHTLAVTDDNDAAEDAVSALLLRQGKLDESISHATREVQLKPKSAEGHARLGVALFRKHELSKALEQFEYVLELRPTFPAIHYDIATVLLEKGQVKEAISEYQKELAQKDRVQLNNDFGAPVASESYVDEALLHANLGDALARDGRLLEAAIEFRAALKISPDRPKFHYNLGSVLLQMGQTDEAIGEFRSELKLQPNDALAHSDLGIALSQTHDVSGAINEWSKALQSEPGNTNAQCNLAWIFSTSPDASIRNGEKAVELARQALERSGEKDPRIFRVLAAAYAENGEFSRASVIAEKGRELAERLRNSNVAQTLESDLSLYRGNIPLREGQ
jgi:tetratricopeptide (TPR) repeat protein